MTHFLNKCNAADVVGFERAPERDRNLFDFDIFGNLRSLLWRDRSTASGRPRVTR